MSFAARCTSASSWSSVMSTRERAQGGLLAAQRGLCAIWMDCIVDWISFLRSTLDRFDRPYRPLPSSASQARRARSPSASASSPWAAWAAWAPWVLSLPLAPLAPVTLILTASLDASVAALRAEGMRSESARASTSSSRPSWPQPSSSATAATATLSSFSSSRKPCYRRRRLPPNPEASAIETRSSSLALLEIKQNNNSHRSECL